MTKDDEIFKGKSFADLMGDIYSNQKKKDRQIITIKLVLSVYFKLVQNICT